VNELQETDRARIRATVVAALLSARPLGDIALDGTTPDQVDDTVHVGETGLGLTSLNVLHALVTIEDALGVVLDDRAVADARLSSVGTVVDLVERQFAEAGD